jgi:nitrate reductase gamma subunit
MSALTVLYALLFYVAAATLVGGVAWKCWVYARTPQPLKIPIPPAPTTRGGVVLRMLLEVTLFRALFRSNKWIWLFGWLFHVALLAVLLRHLRYFTEPVWAWVALIQPFGIYAGFAMLAGLAGLWARRVLVDRVRYISSPSDHLMLALLAAIAASGLAMKYLAHTDIVALPRPDGVRLAAAAGRPGAPHPPRAGGRADDRVSRVEAPARAGGVFQPEPQPGG